MDYSKSIIYTIQKDDMIYVGSTLNYRVRKNAHKSICNNPKDKKYHLKLYQMIRANGGWDAFAMKPYSEFPCESKIQLVIEEERVRKLIGNMNARKAHTTVEERKEQAKEIDAIYREAHKEERKESHAIYYASHKEEIKEYYATYREAHKEERKEYDAIYYVDNATKINERKSKKYTCTCGIELRHGNKAKHERTARHINKLKIS